MKTGKVLKPEVVVRCWCPWLDLVAVAVVGAVQDVWRPAGDDACSWKLSLWEAGYMDQ